MTSLSQQEIDSDVITLHKAMKGFGTDEKALISVLGRRTDFQMQQVAQCFKTSYAKELHEQLAKETSDLQSSKIATWLKDLEQLYKAGEGKVGTDEANFIRLFTTRSDVALRSLFQAYQEQYGKHISKVIKSEFSGTIQKLLVALVEIIENRPQYLAKRFEQTMAGVGTKDELLISMAVRYRDPAMMLLIKKEYLATYKKSLAERIKGETSGYYEKLLVQIVGA